MDIKIDFNVNDSEQSLAALLNRLSVAADLAEQDIHLNLADCGFLGPLAVTTLVLTHMRWMSRGLRVRVTPPTLPRLANYCVYSGLAEQLNFGPAPDPFHPENVTTRIRIFNRRDNQGIQEVAQLVSRFMDLSIHTGEVLKVLIGELVQNVADHAGDVGALSARVYKNERDIRVCVADHGEGLKRALGRVHTVANDQEAIRLALEKGRSGRSHEHNSGQGLHLLDEELKFNKGSLLLASGNGYYRRHSDRCQRGSLDIPLPGTLILMKFRIDNELYGLNGPSDDLW